MNPEAKRLWVEKLCSLSSTQQIQGPLGRNIISGGYGYCAIGVLVSCYCEVTGKLWKEVVKGLDVDEEVFIWAQYNPWTELVKAGEITGRVFDLNDHFKIPFPIIAEGIQKDL